MTTLTDTRQMLNIILVEDDDGDAKAVVRSLARVRVANPIVRLQDGVEALSFLRGEREQKPPPSYVLLIDLNMPRMGGLELLQEIRRDPDLSSAVVFVMSTSNDERDRVAAYSAHIAGYILKQNAGRDFMQLVTALDHYWRIVELPDMRRRG